MRPDTPTPNHSIERKSLAGRRPASWQTALVAVMFVGGLAILFLQYHHGIGLNPDSAFYIAAADSLLSGHGLMSSIGTVPTRLTHHPPAYPVLLAAGKAIAGDFYSAATFLNFASLLCCFLAAYAFAIRQTAPGPALATVCLLACSTPVYLVHYTLSTDSLAIPFLVAAMCWLGDFELGKRRGALVLAALALSAGSLLRYAYVAFIPAACLVLLLDAETPFRKRWRPALQLAAIACAPLIAVMLENRIRAGNATNRVLAFHLITYDQLRDGADTLSSWLLPYRVPVPLRFLTLLMICLLGLVPAVRGPFKYAARITMTFLASYVVLLLGVISFVDESTPLDERLLAPAVVILCLHVALVSGWIWLSQPRWGAAAATLLVLGPALSGARRLAPRVAALYNSQDAGNSLAKLREDYRDIIPILRALPPDRVIYTNVASDIYMVSGRYARDLPEVRGHTDARPRTEEEISAQVRDLSEQVSGSGGGLVVYHLRNRTLSDLSFIWWDDLSRRVPMTLVFHSEAFAVFAGDHEVRRGSNPYTEYENAEFSCPFVRLPACYPAPEAMVL